MSLAGGVQLPSMIQAQNMPQAFGQAYGQIGNLGSTYSPLGSAVLPYAETTMNQQYASPYAGQAMAGASGAAGLGQGAALTGYNTGAGLTGAGMSMIPYASSIMNTAMDPQQALYNRTLNQVQQQVGAQNAASGVGTTPYGAGVMDQALSNFNIDWQNNLLNRQATGASAAGGLLSSGAGVAGQGVNMMNQAPTTLSQTSSIPYATYSGIGTGQDTALSNLLNIGSQGASLSNMSISDLLSYLGMGNQTTSVANQTAQTGLNQSALAFNQLASLGSGAGKLISAFL